MRYNAGELITAMITPFNEDLSIDYPSLEKLINHLIKTGTDGIGNEGTLTFTGGKNENVISGTNGKLNITGNGELKFIFNAKKANPKLTITELGITNNANIFVVNTISNNSEIIQISLMRLRFLLIFAFLKYIFLLL